MYLGEYLLSCSYIWSHDAKSCFELKVNNQLNKSGTVEAIFCDVPWD